MNSTAERPVLDQDLAKRYADKASSELSTWATISEGERESIYYNFALGSLPIFNLSQERPMTLVNDLNKLGHFGSYIRSEEWPLLGWGPARNGGIILSQDLVRFDSPTCAAEVFGHECVHAVQVEIDGLVFDHLCPACPPEREIEAQEFHVLICLALKNHSLFASDIPKTADEIRRRIRGGH